MDSPWEEDPHYAPEAAWHRLSTEFTNVCLSDLLLDSGS